MAALTVLSLSSFHFGLVWKTFRYFWVEFPRLLSKSEKLACFCVKKILLITITINNNN